MSFQMENMTCFNQIHFHCLLFCVAVYSENISKSSNSHWIKKKKKGIFPSGIGFKNSHFGFVLQSPVFCASNKNMSTISNQSSQNIFQAQKHNETLFSYVGPNLVFIQACITPADKNRNCTDSFEGSCLILSVYVRKTVKFNSTVLP